MNRVNNKVLLLIIVVLLITNGVVIALYFFRAPAKKSPARNGRGSVEYMTRELGLDETQASKFNTLWEENNQRNKPLNDSIRVSREELYSYLNTNPQPDSLVQAAAARIARFEQQVLLHNYAHFRQVKEICTPEQQVKLDTLLKKMGNRRMTRRN